MMQGNRRFNLSAKRLELLESMLRAEGVDRSTQASVVPRQDRERPVPLTFPQKRLWFLEQLVPGSMAYAIPNILRIRGELETELFTRACNQVVQRHESLRTVFDAVDGLPQQRVIEGLQVEVGLVDIQEMAPAEREQEVYRRADAQIREPFDLSRGPLLRIELLRLKAEEFVLLLAIHHIVADLWSMAVLLREIVSFYASSSFGIKSDVPELTVQYPDFAVWQQETLPKDTWQKDLEFWVKQLRGASAEIDLPMLKARTAGQSSQAAAVPIELPPPLVVKLRSLARDEGKTPFMVLAAVFKVLLYRLSCQEDIVIGTPVANRNRAEIEPLIGFFVNTIVLRTDLSGNPSFRELLNRVSTTCLEAFDHQDLAFERLVEELQPERSLGQTPLFQVVFLFQNLPSLAWDAGAFKIEPMPIKPGAAKFDLQVQLFEDGDTCQGRIEYNRELFEASTVQSMASYYLRLLHGVVDDPEQKILKIPLMHEAERARRVKTFNEPVTALTMEVGELLAGGPDAPMPGV